MALYELHILGMIHCDVKPSNILIQVGENITNIVHVVLADFSITSSNPIMECYTIGYRAPGIKEASYSGHIYFDNIEDIRAKRRKLEKDFLKPNSKTDIYALGVSLVMFINNKIFYVDSILSHELASARIQLREHPEKIQLLDRMLMATTLDIDFPYYAGRVDNDSLQKALNFRNWSNTYSLQQNKNAFDQMRVLAAEVDCLPDTIQLATDILFRYIHERHPPMSGNIAELIEYYSAMNLASIWLNDEGIPGNIEAYIMLSDIPKLTQFTLKMARVLDGLIYIPNYNITYEMAVGMWCNALIVI